jgi:acetylornithine aminotransferase
MSNFDWTSNFLSNYGTPEIELVEGEGVIVKDSQGNIYLDFLSGIAVNALGHAHPKIIEAVDKQIRKLSHTSNFYANKPAIILAEKLIEISGMKSKVFFCNSGAEANEAAIKLSRLTKRKNLISLNNSFHGRTMGALSITGQFAKQKPFLPLLGNVKFIDINQNRGLRKINSRTSAFFIEPIQGEGGVIECSNEYLQKAKNRTSKKKALLVVDEVQTGFGRTGKWFGYQHAEIFPDVVTLAKGLGGGLPMGAILVGESAMDLFQPGMHGTTFGGNPIVASAALAVIETIEKQELLINAENMGGLLKDLLGQIVEVKEVRGKGLLLGCEFKNVSAKDLEKECRKLGLLVNSVNDKTLRIAPPLIVNLDQIKRCAEIIHDAIDNLMKLGIKK